MNGIRIAGGEIKDTNIQPRRSMRRDGRDVLNVAPTRMRGGYKYGGDHLPKTVTNLQKVNGFPDARTP